MSAFLGAEPRKLHDVQSPQTAIIWQGGMHGSQMVHSTIAGTVQFPLRLRETLVVATLPHNSCAPVYSRSTGPCDVIVSW